MTTIKWIVAAVGAYLLYIWWRDSQAAGEVTSRTQALEYLNNLFSY